MFSEVSSNQIIMLSQQLALAYDSYKKHPCLIDQSKLLTCLDNFVDHFDCFEDFVRADIANDEAQLM